MTEITHVLAGVELSHASSDAMVRAAQVARESRARLTVLHALGWEAPSVVQALLGLDTDHLTRDSTVKATAQLARRLAELDIVGTDVEQAIETGVPGPTIASSCRERAADLVVIGDRVSSRVHRALFGSTSSYLLRTSSVPVLVVKSPADRHYRDVLIAVDFSPASVRSVVLARALAPNARIHVIHVTTFPLESLMHYADATAASIAAYRNREEIKATAALHDLATQAGVGPEHRVSTVTGSDPAEQILDYVDQHDCGLIALGKHGTHRTAELLLGSVTQDVLAATESDALVVVDAEAPVGNS